MVEPVCWHLQGIIVPGLLNGGWVAKTPWNDSFPQTPANNGFNHGFNLVRNGFRPSTVGAADVGSASILRVCRIQKLCWGTVSSSILTAV